jgi:hypothetical protein
MADNAGMAAIRAAAAKKQNMGGKVASALQGSKGSNGSSSNSGSPNNAIARRLAKGSSKSGPTKNDHDGDEQESGY